MEAIIDMNVLTEALAVGTASVIGGALLPLLFRMIGYVVDLVRVVLL